MSEKTIVDSSANSKAKNLTLKAWFLIVLLNLVAKIGWAIENTWFTSFVYAEVAYDVNITSWMVAVSAIASTVTTLVFGTLSDRIGKRKPLIVWGFICWGLVTFVFAFGAKLSNLVIAGIFCVIMDGIMSAIGSIGSDAGYMAWTTDITTKQERATLGAWLGVMPLLSAMVVSVIAGPVVDKLGYFWLFGIVGGIVTVFGLISIFVVKDSPNLVPQKRGSFTHQLLEVFDVKSFVKNKALMMVLIVYAVYMIIFDVWMPYSTVYMINYLGFSATQASMGQGIGIIVATLCAIPFTKLVKKGKEFTVLSLVTLVSVVGGIVVGAAAFGKNYWVNLVGSILLLIGYVGVEQTCVAWMKNLFPTNAYGQYEGIRMVFYVAIPMVFGSLLANFLISNFGAKMADGVVINEVVFFIVAALSIIIIIPSYFANKFVKEKVEKGEEK